jgi:hypothetical protein
MHVEIFINNQLVSQSTQAPFYFTFIPQNIDNSTTTKDITIIGYDSMLNKTLYTGKLLLQ